MTDDILDLLHDADPARDHAGCDSAGYDDARISRQVSQIVAATARTGAGVRQPRGLARRWGVPTAAFVAVAGAGLATAAAAGWLSPGARQAFDSPDARQMLLQLYGSTADLDQARERVTAPGPDGSTVSTWTVPVAGRGRCTAILVSKPSAPPTIGSGQRPDLPTVCESVPAAGQVQRSVRFLSLQWRSKKTGTEYLIYSGPLTPASQVQLRLANGSRPAATTGDGYYLLPAVPVTDLTCAALVGLDAHGHQVGLPSYLTSGCPGDPYRPGTAPPPAKPGTTVTEDEPKQAVVYSAGDVEVNVASVVRQDRNRGVGSSAPGMSLVTIRLQFFRQPSSRAALPTAVSFDLLYGADHRAAAVDPGKHHDPDLSGVWSPPQPDDSVWLPQLSFDVPTDQLATLQVRLNGDATHPTILFRTVPVEN